MTGQPDRLAEIKARLAKLKTESSSVTRIGMLIELGKDAIPWLVAEAERLRKLVPAEWESATCRICGEPITRAFAGWWHDETTRDHDAAPAAP